MSQCTTAMQKGYCYELSAPVGRIADMLDACSEASAARFQARREIDGAHVALAIRVATAVATPSALLNTGSRSVSVVAPASGWSRSRQARSIGAPYRSS